MIKRRQNLLNCLWINTEHHNWGWYCIDTKYVTLNMQWNLSRNKILSILCICYVCVLSVLSVFSILSIISIPSIVNLHNVVDYGPKTGDKFWIGSRSDNDAEKIGWNNPKRKLSQNVAQLRSNEIVTRQIWRIWLLLTLFYR